MKELAMRKKLEAEEMARKRKSELESVVEKLAPNIWQEMERQMNLTKMSKFKAAEKLAAQKQATRNPTTRIKEQGNKEWKSRPVPLRPEFGSQYRVTKPLQTNNGPRKHDSRPGARRIRTEKGNDRSTNSRNTTFNNQNMRNQPAYNASNSRNLNMRANGFGIRYGPSYVRSEMP